MNLYLQVGTYLCYLSIYFAVWCHDEWYEVVYEDIPSQLKSINVLGSVLCIRMYITWAVSLANTFSGIGPALIKSAKVPASIYSNTNDSRPSVKNAPWNDTM